MVGIAEIAVASLLALAAAGMPLWDAPDGPNLLRNPSFEQAEDGRPTEWGMSAPPYSIDRTGARTGVTCLKYVNADPDLYQLATQRVDIEPGARYDIRAWVRTEGIAGRDSGATICLEWYGPDGGWMGGFYPDGLKGDTAEWTEVGAVSPRIPEGAADARIHCYVRRGMTGTAWWDDVSVRRVRQKPLNCMLVTPSYRGWVLDSGPDHAEIRARFVWDDVPVAREATRLTCRLLPAAGGGEVAATAMDGLPADEARVRLDLPQLDPGQYELRVELAEKATGAVPCAEALPIERRTGPLPHSYVDEHNRLIVDGQPFFPLGMYWSGVREDQLRIYADGPFNCLMPYGRPTRDQMDMIGRFGLKAFYSIKDFYHGTQWCPPFIASEADEERAVREHVRTFRDHPALLGWYINDERPLSMLPRLAAHQRWVEEEDADHPTWTVLYQITDVAGYVSSFDVAGTDPYPLPRRPVSMAGEWARMTREAVAGARAVWMVPQAFSQRAYGQEGRAPTLDELRSMTWQCIAEGANGIVFYSWFDLWRDPDRPFEEGWDIVGRIAEEVDRCMPALLSVDPLPELTIEAPQAVHWTARALDRTLYVFLVNSAEETCTATVRMADGVVERDLGPLAVEIIEQAY